MAVFGKKSLNPGDPILTGGPGPDVFDAPAGNAGIDAFGGIDTVNFNFRLVDATIRYSGATVIIDTATSHTELTGVQRYVFTDGTVDENDGNALVDDLYYYSRNHDVWSTNGDAEAHFAQFGWQEGRNPSAFFNTKLYLVANSDVLAAGVDPLEHFHTFGWKEGRLPSIKFDTFQYLQNNPDVAAAGVDPLEHFLAVGREEGRASYISNFSVFGPSGFDHAYYLLQNPDVEAAGVDPLEHFLTFGWREGRNPNAWFDTRGYLATYADVAAAGVNPFEHYLQFGWKEGRNPLPAFDTDAYLLANPDVAAAGVNPLVHYLMYGVHEGRKAFSDDFGTFSNPVVLEGSASGTVIFPGLSWGNWLSPLLSFTLTGDSSGGGYAVNSATGALTVANGSLIDFETSGGANTLTVLAQLGSLSKALTFTVGVADAAPSISSNVLVGNILEGAANGTTVGITVTGSDPNGPAPIFTLANDAGGRFTIDASGVISVANGAAIDFETAPGHTYSLTARATVGALSADLLLTINVGNVNEAPAGADHTAEVAENSVHTFTAADFGFTDPNDNPTPNNLAGVVITAITGAGSLTNNGTPVANGDFISAADIAAGNLKFTPAANANGNNYASFAFQVRDDGGTANGGVNTDQSANTMTIDVNAVNDTPSFTVGADQTVNEDAGPQTVNGFATGISAGPADEAGQAVDFIVSNNDNALFAVQPTIDASGNLTYTLAADANGSATVTVQIHDNGGGADTSAPQTFVINVNAVNDAPVNAVPGAQSVNEDTDLVLSGANALLISDVDIGAGNATVTLSVLSGALTLSTTAGLAFSVGDGTSDATMTFSGTVGAINAALNGLVYRGNLDASGLDTLTLNTDDQGNTGIDPGLSGTATSEADTDTVAITVNAVNDAPVNAVPGAQSVNEDTDLVLSGANALSISDVDIGAGNATVTLSVLSGVLTLSTTAGLAFSVGDGTSDATMTFSGTVGAINAALNGLVYRGNLDASGLDTLTLNTDDQGNTGIDPGLSGTATSEADTDAVAITVNPVNDEPALVAAGNNPSYTPGADLFTVTSLTAVESGQLIDTMVLSVTNVSGTDESLFIDGTSVPLVNGTTPTATAGISVTVSLSGTTAQVTLTSSPAGLTGAALGTIIENLTYTKTAPALNEPARVVTIVSLHDDGGTLNGGDDTANPGLTSTVSFNQPPVITSNGGGAAAAVSMDENTTVTGVDVNANDPDNGPVTPLVYSIAPGGDGALFTIDSGTGLLTFTSAPNFENPTDSDTNNTYIVTVRASDGAAFDDQTITITVNDVVEAPVIGSNGGGPTASITVNENQTAVTDVDATDPDLPAQTLTYSLVGGTDQAKFNINSGTGVLTFISAPNFESPTDSDTNNTYVVTVRASDGTLFDDQTITVTVNDVAEAPVIGSNGGGPTASITVNENQTAVTDVDATDPDLPAQTLTYSLVGGTDQAKFNINSGTGVLTFISAPNFESPTDSDSNNTYVVTVRASDGTLFDDQTITVTVNDVAEAPVIGSNGGGPTASITVNENQTAVTDVDATDPDLPAQTLTYSLVGGTDQAKFNINSGTGVLTLISAPNFESPTDSDSNNTYVVTVRASDGTLFDDQTITVTVANVNEQPTLAATGATIPYTEDTPSEDHTVTLFTGVAASAVEPGQNLDQLVLTVSNVVDTSERLFIDGSTIALVAGNSSTATNSMSVNVAFSGSTATVTIEKVSGITAAAMQALIAGLAYSNNDESPTAGARLVTLVSLRDVGSNVAPNDNIFESIGISTTINVVPVNDAPVLTAPGAINTFIEGAGLATGTPVFVDTAFTVADTDNDNMASATVSITAGLQTGDMLSFTPQFGITDTNAAPEILALSGSATKAQWETVLRSITFATSTQDPTTSRTISIQVSDGTSNSNTATKNVTITPVNDEPTLTATANGGGAVTFTETSLPGDAGSGPVDLFSSPTASTVEAGQAITQLVVTVTNVTDTTEFLMIGGTAVDLVNGNSEAVTGGTASVSIASGTATVTITPTTTFTTAQVQTLVDSLAYDSNDNTPTATTHTISVTSLTDNGANGGANGHDNTGAPSVSTVVTVVPTNDAPVAADFTFNGTNAAIGNTSLVVNDPTDGAPDPAGPQKTITGDLLAGATDVDTASTSWTITAVGGGTTATDANGTIIFQPDGDFTYLPAAGVTGNVVYQYQVNDNDALGSKSDTGQITINIATPKVWYVNAATGSDVTGDGTSDNPFASLTKLNGVTGDGTTNDDVDGTGDIIFLYGGTYTGGIVLEDGQQLISKENGLTVNGTVLEAADGSSLTTINGTVTLANTPATANNIQGIDFGATSGFALTGTNVGNATVNTVTSGQINNTSGGAINIDGSGTGMNLQFTSVSSTGGTNAISFNQARGTFNSGSGTLSNATGNTVNITGSGSNKDLTFTYGGAISDDGNLLVNITGQTGGTKTFGGTLTDGSGAGGGISIGSSAGTFNFNGQVTLNTTTATAVNLTSNTGATINFNPAGTGLDITTTTGIGFNATGGATAVNVQGSGNSINSSSATALNILNTTIGASNVTFHDISSGNNTAAADPANGIVLNNTGASGSLIVTGDGNTSVVNGTNSSGGIIQGTTGAGILLTNTLNPSFTNVHVLNTVGSGVDGTDVTGFTFRNGKIDASGTVAVANTSNIAFNDVGSGINNLDGAVSITGNVLSNAAYHGVDILNESGTISSLTISNNTLTATGNDATTKGSGIHVDVNGSASTAAAVTVGTVANNTINNFSNGAGISFQGGNAAFGPAVTLGVPGAGTSDATGPGTGASLITISGNVIGNASIVGGIGTNGIIAGVTGTGQGNFSIINNGTAAVPIQHFEGIGITAFGGNKANVNFLINNNFIDATDNIFGSSGMSVGSQVGGADATQTGTVRAEITNNNIFGMDGVGILASITNSFNTGYFKIVGNTVGSPTGGVRPGIRIESGSSTGDTTVFLEISGNTSGGSGGHAGIGLRKQGSVSGTNELHIEGLSPSPANHAQMETYLSGLNPGSVLGTGYGGGPSRVLSISGENYLSGNVDFLAAVGGEGPGSAATLTADMLAVTLAGALHRWHDAGITPDQLALLDGIEIKTGDLSAGILAGTSGQSITIDANAAGWGWFVDATPADDAEFAAVHSPTELAAAGGNASSQIDLLTVIMHEIGHALGLEHTDAPGNLMDDAIDVGIRRLPSHADAVTADAGALHSDAPLPAQAFVGQNIVGGFDAEYYLAHNPDVAAAGVDPHAHYETFGWHEGRNPNAFFDAAGYLAHYADVAAAGVDPLQHYAEFGWKEGRDPSAGFDTQAYLAANPDVAAAHVNPLDHYLHFGVHEGRLPESDGIWR